MAEGSHAAWVVRDYRDDLFERCLRLLESTNESQHSTFALSELLGALRDRQPAVVALHGDEVLGAAIGMVAGTRGWVARLAIDDGWRGMGIPSALLAALEAQFLLRKVQHVSYVLAVEEQLAEGLVNAGYERRSAVAYFEKTFPLDPSQAVLLDKLGGFMTPASQWESLGGMACEKDLIERRVLAPLLHAESAARHGVSPPRAIMLFGPPGTGKTSFARAVAARLHWPFVEILPSRLASEPNELANALRDVFATVAELDNVVVFWDEIEDHAANRDETPRPPAHTVTNELLKLIPVFREQDNRLLVAATNDIARVDGALLRPGRFDYVIPIGLPDKDARRDMLLKRNVPDRIDLDAVIAASDGLTAAELNHVVSVAAQMSFERDVYAEEAEDDAPTADGPTTADFVTAAEHTRASVTTEIRQKFERDTQTFARL